MVVGRALEGPLVKYFQQRLMLLAVPFVERETGVALNHHSVKCLKNVFYKSGGGVNRKTPWPVHVEAGNATPKPKKRLDQDRVASAYDELLGDASNGLNFHQGKLTGIKKKQVVKKGFLNSDKLKKEGTGMYDETGSGEGVLPDGAGDPMGWMPKKLRNMCKVVDTGQENAEKQQQAMEDYAKHGNRTQQPNLPKRITAEELAKLPAEQRKLYEPEGGAQPDPLAECHNVLEAKGERGDAALDACAKIASEGGLDWSSADMSDAISSFAEMMSGGEFGDASGHAGVADSLMQSLLGNTGESSSTDSHQPTRQPKPEPKIVKGIGDEALDDIKLCDDEESEEEEEIFEPAHDVTTEDGLVTVTVELIGVTSLAGVDLDIDTDCVHLEVPDKYTLNTRLPVEIDIDSVQAKFDKSSQVLTIHMCQM